MLDLERIRQDVEDVDGADADVVEMLSEHVQTLTNEVERLRLQVRGQDNESARLHRALRCIIRCASVPFMENNPETLRERLLGCRELAIGAHGDDWDAEIV
jgi:hypothetical protein